MRKKTKWNAVLGWIFMLMTGGACGFLAGDLIGGILDKGKGTGTLVITIFLGLVWLYFVVLLEIILHEGGHLIFGLLTGYRFSSFRIMSVMFVKENGKLRRKKFSLAGTGGQCLMLPPDMVDGQIPYVLYNMGGVILNLFTAVLAGIIGLFMRGNENVFAMLMIVVLVGLVMALTNGIPLSVGGVDNDGRNAISLGKNSAAMRAFWIQMQINGLLAQGKRIQDMPEEWFVRPSDEEMHNSMCAALGVLACNKMLVEHRFGEALEEMEDLLSKDTGMIGLHSALLKVDCIFCELLGEKREAKLNELRDGSVKKVMKTMKKYPSVLRTEYAWAMLQERNEKKAGKILERFQKVKKDYPYKEDIKAEEELIEEVNASVSA